MTNVQAENVADGPTWWRQPDGSGPFALHRWEEGDFLIVKQNEPYHGTPPSVSAVIYYLSSGSGLAAYEAGQLDAATVAPANLSRAEDPADPLSADLQSGNTFCTYRVVFDTTREPFDDPLIRQAFALSINRTQIADVVLHGAATPATGLLPPGMPGSVTRSVDDSFDVDAALSLIAKSDLRNAEALPDITFTSPGESEPDPVAVALADMWSTNLGVTIKTELLEPSGYADAVATEGGHMYTYQWCAAYADPENVLDLPYHSDGPANLGGYANAEVDDLLEKARTEPNPGKRLEYYQEAENLLLTDAPAIPIIHPGAHVLIRPYIRGYDLTTIPVLWPAYVTIERQE